MAFKRNELGLESLKLMGALQCYIDRCDSRFKHFVAAGAYRTDGTFVLSINGHPRHNVMHAAHAEMRLLRKASPEEIYVIRMNKKNELLDSMPCPRCAAALRKRGVRKVICAYGGDVVKVIL